MLIRLVFFNLWTPWWLLSSFLFPSILSSCFQPQVHRISLSSPSVVENSSDLSSPCPQRFFRPLKHIPNRSRCSSKSKGRLRPRPLRTASSSAQANHLQDRVKIKFRCWFIRLEIGLGTLTFDSRDLILIEGTSAHF